MTTVQLVLTIIQLIFAVVLVVMVMVQSGKSEGLPASLGGGNSESFLAKNQSKTLDAKLAKYTKWVAFIFMALTLALCLV